MAKTGRKRLWLGSAETDRNNRRWKGPRCVHERLAVGTSWALRLGVGCDPVRLIPPAGRAHEESSARRGVFRARPAAHGQAGLTGFLHSWDRRPYRISKTHSLS
jgi:hypothetical protein